MYIRNVEELLVVVDHRMHRQLRYQSVDLEDLMDLIREFLPMEKESMR